MCEVGFQMVENLTLHIDEHETNGVVFKLFMKLCVKLRVRFVHGFCGVFGRFFNVEITTKLRPRVVKKAYETFAMATKSRVCVLRIL